MTAVVSLATFLHIVIAFVAFGVCVALPFVVQFAVGEWRWRSVRRHQRRLTAQRLRSLADAAPLSERPWLRAASRYFEDAS